MSWKQSAKDYLIFSKRDRLGLLALFGLILIMYLLTHLNASSASGIALAPEVLGKAIDTLQAKSEARDQRFNNDEQENNYSYSYEPSQTGSFIKGELFRFDPNTLPTEGWKRLGLNDHTIKTINNYRSKGGHFYKPEDLKKIWGLPKGFYERLADYIMINSVQQKRFAFQYENQHQNSFNAYTKPERKMTVVDVNTADTAALITLPGIGSKLATRITNFRDKLGGFYSVDQIGETYALPDSTFQKLKPYFSVNPSQVQKININSATKDELKIHPYIRWNLANVIVEYRNQHGAYKSLDELKNIALVDEATFSKIVPYLSL